MNNVYVKFCRIDVLNNKMRFEFTDDNDVNPFYVLTRQRIVPQHVIQTINQEICRCGYHSKYLISIDQTLEITEEFIFERSYFEYSYSNITESSTVKVVPNTPSPSVSRSIFPIIPSSSDSSPSPDPNSCSPMPCFSPPPVPLTEPRYMSPIPVPPVHPTPFYNDPTPEPSPKPLYIDPIPLPSQAPLHTSPPVPTYIAPKPLPSPAPIYIDPKPLPVPAPFYIPCKPKTLNNYIAPKPKPLSVSYTSVSKSLTTPQMSHQNVPITIPSTPTPFPCTPKTVPSPTLHPIDPKPVLPQLPHSSVRSSSHTQTSYSGISRFELPKICPITWKVKTFDSLCVRILFFIIKIYTF